VCELTVLPPSRTLRTGAKSFALTAFASMVSKREIVVVINFFDERVVVNCVRFRRYVDDLLASWIGISFSPSSFVVL
jgi:hypothetical protein